ncbi:MAG: DJ-1/PfpI family protein [Desulfobacterales bacterium]|nr:DJ-1/PfpI family protein [Desulfobacterales bacterium]
MSKKVLVPIADGSEEIEAVCIIDVLRRAGAEVTVASVEKDLQITASRGVKIVADAKIDDCANEEFDLIVLPGGMPGAERLRDSEPLAALLRRQKESEKPYAAICAAPAVSLQPHGLLEGRKATAHPGFVDQLQDPSAAESRVVADGIVVTSRAPGTAIEFALALVALLFGEKKAEEVAGPMLVAGR